MRLLHYHETALILAEYVSVLMKLSSSVGDNGDIRIPKVNPSCDTNSDV